MPDSPAPRHSVSVAAVIFDDSGDNVLLIKRRDNGRWEPPGGVLELEEAVEDGLRREVREETGVEIEIGPLTGIYKNVSRGILALVFRCTASGTPLESSTECSSIAWQRTADIARIMTRAFAIRVSDAARFLEEQRPNIRSHDGLDIL